MFLLNSRLVCSEHVVARLSYDVRCIQCLFFFFGSTGAKPLEPLHQLQCIFDLWYFQLMMSLFRTWPHHKLRNICSLKWLEWLEHIMVSGLAISRSLSDAVKKLFVTIFSSAFPRISLVGSSPRRTDLLTPLGNPSRKEAPFIFQSFQQVF